MAAPNLQSPTTINGKTSALNLAATTETALLTNAASSGKAIRVKSITVANVNTSATADITLRYYSAASSGTAYPIGPITIPASGAIVLIGSENPIWLEEDRRLTVQASAANYLTVLCSYEDAS
jgi:hypothetical protein